MTTKKTTRIVLDPDCPMVIEASHTNAEPENGRVPKLHEIVQWRKHHKLLCQRCSEYAARDAELKAQAIATFQPDDDPLFPLEGQCDICGAAHHPTTCPEVVDGIVTKVK